MVFQCQHSYTPTWIKRMLRWNPKMSNKEPSPKTLWKTEILFRLFLKLVRAHQGLSLKRHHCSCFQSFSETDQAQGLAEEPIWPLKHKIMWTVHVNMWFSFLYLFSNLASNDILVQMAFCAVSLTTFDSCMMTSYLLHVVSLWCLAKQCRLVHFGIMLDRHSKSVKQLSIQGHAKSLSLQ